MFKHVHIFSVELLGLCLIGLCLFALLLGNDTLDTTRFDAPHLNFPHTMNGKLYDKEEVTNQEEIQLACRHLADSGISRYAIIPGRPLLPRQPYHPPSLQQIATSFYHMGRYVLRGQWEGVLWELEYLYDGFRYGVGNYEYEARRPGVGAVSFIP